MDGHGRTILVSGYAQLPEGTITAEHGKVFGVVLEVDPGTDRIVRAEFSFVTRLANDFLCRLVEGQVLGPGLDDLVATVESAMWVPSQKAIVRALRNAYNRYREFRVQYVYVHRAQ